MITHSPKDGIRLKRSLFRLVSIGATLLLSLVLVGVALADLEIPVIGIPVFLQTTGRLALLGVGDYRTNAAGDDSPHQVVVNVGCLPNAVVRFDVFDPEVYRETASPPTIDEPRSAANTLFGDIADCRVSTLCDPTTFTLVSPGGATITTQTFTSSNATNEQWVTLATVTLPAAPVFGTDCGLYTLRTQTGDLTQPSVTELNNDDNAWRFRLVGVDDGSGNPFPVEDGPDGLPGTGDELWIGLQQVSYQHISATPPSCQDFFWFADDGETNMFMLNFDMDNNTSVTYRAPDATVITGTLSGSTVWNDIPPQQQARPTYPLMATFSPPGDLLGDAIANPLSGIWDATLCVNNDNQYSMEVPNNFVFLEEPELPDVTIAKTDGVTTVSSPGTTTYTITLTNTGPGAALPLPGSDPEVVDQLPAGMTFSSCTVNAPLVGTCSHVGGGRIEFQLQAQSATVPAYLQGVSRAPNNAGTLTVVANINAGLPPGTSLTNTATVDYTDIYSNNHAPRQATDIDFVAGGADIDLSLTKTVDDNTPAVGQVITYTLTVSNAAGVGTATGVQVADVLPAGLAFVSATPSQGSYNSGTGVWTVGTLASPGSATLQIQARVVASGTIRNYAQVSSADQADIDSTPNNGNGSTPVEDDEAAVDITAPPAADLSVTKSVDNPFPTLGSTITYTVTVSNAGPDAATNVVVSDPLPAGLTYVSDTPSQGTFDSGTGDWTVGTIPAGGLATLRITVTFDSTTPVTNIAQVTASDQPDPDSTPNNNDPTEDDQASLTLPQQPPAPPGGPAPLVQLRDPALSKAGDPSAAAIGERISWTITISNPGSVAFSGVVVSDPVPDVLDILSATSSRGTVTVNGQLIQVDVGVLQPGDTITVNVATVANARAVAGQVCNTARSGTASATGCITLFPREIPPLGGGAPPPSARPIELGVAVLVAALAVLGWWRLRRQAAG